MSMSATTLLRVTNQAITTTAPGSMIQWDSQTNANRSGWNATLPDRYTVQQSGYYLLNVVLFTSVLINCRAFLTNQGTGGVGVVGGRIAELITNSNNAGFALQTFSFCLTYYLPATLNIGINVLPSANCDIQYRSDATTFSGPKWQIVQLTGAINA